MKHWKNRALPCLAGLCLVLVLAVAAKRADSGPLTAESQDAASRSVAALHAAVAVNLDYCRQWLDEKDLKTLRQTAEGITLLADALQSVAEDAAWQKSVAGLRQAARELAAAAGMDSSERCREKLAALQRQAKSLAALTPGAKPAKPGKPSAPLRSMMELLDGTYADAKRSLTFGEIEETKQTSLAMRELGRLLSTYRGDARWKSLSREFTAATEEAANADANDAKAVRTALRGVYERCEACHKRRK